MTDCPNMPVCSFFMVYGESIGHKAAVSGFVRIYCKGDLQEKCVRKAVSKAMGGPHMVPPNILPSGYPVSGTDDSAWSPRVKEIVREHRGQIPQ